MQSVVLAGLSASNECRKIDATEQSREIRMESLL